MYNYLKEMTRDIVDYVKDNYTLKDLEDPDFRDTLYDELWIEDDVTGNGVRGSYWTTDSENKSRAIVFNGTNVDLLIEALEEFGNEIADYKRALKDPNFADITIRCYLLGEAIDKALQVLPEILKEEELDA